MQAVFSPHSLFFHAAARYETAYVFSEILNFQDCQLHYLPFHEARQCGERLESSWIRSPSHPLCFTPISVRNQNIMNPGRPKTNSLRQTSIKTGIVFPKSYLGATPARYLGFPLNRTTNLSASLDSVDSKPRISVYPFKRLPFSKEST